MSVKLRSAQTSKGMMVQVKWSVLAQIYHNGVLDQGDRTCAQDMSVSLLVSPDAN